MSLKACIPKCAASKRHVTCTPTSNALRGEPVIGPGPCGNQQSPPMSGSTALVSITHDYHDYLSQSYHSSGKIEACGDLGKIACDKAQSHLGASTEAPVLAQSPAPPPSSLNLSLVSVQTLQQNHILDNPTTKTPTQGYPGTLEFMSIENLKTFDPFAEADEDTGETKQSQNYIHIRIQQRNGRKTLTTVQGLPKKFDQKKILKVIKKKFACNGTIVTDNEMGEVIQLQGDQRKDVQEFLTDKKEGLELDVKTIKVHGF
ncbi:hypothetical protein V500_08940 [Pseudogymnoascus sp. VKM F-4518 (FW-2643)]|nr:hypothetical protein V500_08940 [Pseudogymnoascus sp. VKM F-4518 (FW-2643)]